MPDRVIVAITGASGAIYGVRTLERLQTLPEIETHLVVSQGARATLALETEYRSEDVEALADVVHNINNLAAPISSGSFRVRGMIIAPCSVKTLSAIAVSGAANLITRAADVMLKERFPLVLLFRETPLHVGHVRIMKQAAEAGATLMPPVPAFYHRPKTIDDIVNQSVGRALDQLGLESGTVPRWTGPSAGAVPDA